ncbi:MAG TPA: hypothetical protein DIV86_03555 [Alphaproteobacteria bacterium]|nr:hypothetical protein [Alphaproteobacteria bacterium]
MKYLVVNNINIDVGLTNKMLSLRSDFYRHNANVDCRTEFNEFDKKSKFILALNDDENVVGMCRVQIAPKNDKSTLSFRSRQIYECLDYILPGDKYFDYSRAELSNLIVTEQLRGDGVQKELLRRAFDLCKENNVDMLYLLPSEGRENISSAIKFIAEEQQLKCYNFQGDFGGKINLLGLGSAARKNLHLVPISDYFRSKVDKADKQFDPKVFNSPGNKVNFGDISLRKVKAVLLDWDLLLANPMPAYANSYSYVIKKMQDSGIPYNHSAAYDPEFIPIKSYFSNLFGEENFDKAMGFF